MGRIHREWEREEAEGENMGAGKKMSYGGNLYET